MAPTASAQDFRDLKTPESPLVLKSQGSFFVGGDSIERTFAQLGGFSPAGRVTVHQKYVRYTVPQSGDAVPVVMIHGMALTGKTWETTHSAGDVAFQRRGHVAGLPYRPHARRSPSGRAVPRRRRPNAPTDGSGVAIVALPEGASVLEARGEAGMRRTTIDARAGAQVSTEIVLERPKPPVKPPSP